MAKKPPGKPAKKPDKERCVTAEGPVITGQKLVPRNARTWFRPGEEWTGNAAGRPEGSRHQLGEDFLHDLREAWQRDGKAAIAHMARNDPSGFVKVVASLLPKESTVEVKKLDVREFTTAELTAIIIAEGAGGEGAASTPEHPGKPH